MAYELIPEVTTVGSEAPAQIRFYYPTDNIFNSVHIRTSYRAKNIKNQAGESQLDDIAISLQEKDMVVEILEQAIYDIFVKMHKIVAESVANPYFINEEITLVNTNTTIASGSVIEDNDAYIHSLLPNIDKKIENCIRYYVLSEWYVSVSLAEDAALNRQKYLEYLTETSNLTFQLRKKLMS